MKRFSSWVALLLVALATSSTLAQDRDKQRSGQQDDALSDVEFTGRKIDAQELADSEPRQVIGKDDLVSVFSGNGLGCKNGALRAGYSHPGGFVFDDGTVAADDVIAEVKRRRGQGSLSCFFVESAEYDRAIFDRLVKAIGTG